MKTVQTEERWLTVPLKGKVEIFVNGELAGQILGALHPSQHQLLKVKSYLIEEDPQRPLTRTMAGRFLSEQFF